MRVLFLSSQAMFRDTRFGGAKRLYYLARELDARVDLSVITLDTCAEIGKGPVPPSEFKRELFLPMEFPSGFAERLPFFADTCKTIRRHREAVRAFAGTRPYDAVLVAFPGALRFLTEGLLPPARRVVYLEDDLLWEQSRARLRALPFSLRWLHLALRHAQLRLFYRRALRRASAFVTISAEEEALALRRFPRLEPHRVGYGVPLEEYPLLPPPERLESLGFIGNYRHGPNLDAARWLIRELFPDVQAKIPEARLVLCGANMPEALQAEARANPAIDLRGEVKDLAEFYGRIGVFVNAVREGRGLRTKAVEAAAYGRPVVSTPLGSEGLDALNAGTFENGAELAESVRGLCAPGAWERASRRARASVEAEFSTWRAGERLLRALSCSG